MNIADITTASKDIIAMLGEYHNAPRREMHLDPMLYALLKGRFTHIARQHHVRIYGSPRPKRIDFRYGGSNPVVIEFAVRPPNGGGQLYGTQNVSELRKLCRVSSTQARHRVLLLIDLCPSELAKDNLRATYTRTHAGPGKFTRNDVRVVYVHDSLSYDFVWSPFQS